MLRKSKRLDYHESEPSAQVHRYADSSLCTFKLMDARGNADVERYLSRKQLCALWQLLGGALNDWPVDGNEGCSS